MGTRPIDLTNRAFGMLTALHLVGTDLQGAKWECQCSCGATVERYAKELLRRQGLTAAGYPMSCGCVQAGVARIA
jgi:hypothetical protein